MELHGTYFEGENNWILPTKNLTEHQLKIVNRILFSALIRIIPRTYRKMINSYEHFSLSQVGTFSKTCDDLFC